MFALHVQSFELTANKMEMTSSPESAEYKYEFKVIRMYQFIELMILNNLKTLLIQNTMFLLGDRQGRINQFCCASFFVLSLSHQKSGLSESPA